MCRWQRWITEEQARLCHASPPDGAGVLRSEDRPRDLASGAHAVASSADVPPLLHRLVSDVNARLADAARRSRAPDATDILGELMVRFAAIHPFLDGNGRTGRVLASYVAAWCDLPILVFRAIDRPLLFAAQRSQPAMRAFLADRICMATHVPGRTVERSAW